MQAEPQQCVAAICGRMQFTAICHCDKASVTNIGHELLTSLKPSCGLGSGHENTHKPCSADTCSCRWTKATLQHPRCCYPATSDCTWLSVPDGDSLHFSAVHMEWRSRRSVPTPLSKALILYLLLLLPILMHRHNESKAKALASLHKARSASKAQSQEDPQEPDSLKGPGGAFEGLKTLPDSVTDKHGSRVMMGAPMQTRVETFDQTKALIGAFATRCPRFGSLK